MADNVELDPGSGGAVIKTDDDGTAQWPYSKTAFGADGTRTRVTSSTGLPVKVVQGVTPGTGATDLGKAEDAVHGSGDVGVMALAVRNDALAALGADGDYVPLQVTEDGALWTESEPNHINADNSTTDVLDGDAVYTGTGTDVLGSAAVTIQIDASHDSATDGMSFEFSTDNSNWDAIHLFTYTATNGARVFQFASHSNYFRLVYTNGDTQQTHFRVQTILHHTTPITSIHRLVDDTSPDRSATLHKSAIIAQAAGSGDFVPVQATAGGNLKVAIEEISDGLDIGAGNAESETQRVSISTDDVNLSAIKSAVEIMDDWDESNRAKVNPIVGQAGVAADAGAVDATVPRVTLASDDPAVAKLGTIDTSLNNIEGSVVGPASPTIDSYTHAAINLTTGADQVLASSAANKQIWVYGYFYTCGDADGQSVSFQDEDDVALSGVVEHARYGGGSVPLSGNFSMPIWKLGTDKDLEVDILGGDVDGWIAYAILSV